MKFSRIVGSFWSSLPLLLLWLYSYQETDAAAVGEGLGRGHWSGVYFPGAINDEDAFDSGIIPASEVGASRPRRSFDGLIRGLAVLLGFRPPRTRPRGAGQGATAVPSAAPTQATPPPTAYTVSPTETLATAIKLKERENEGRVEVPHGTTWDPELWAKHYKIGWDVEKAGGARRKKKPRFPPPKTTPFPSEKEVSEDEDGGEGEWEGQSGGNEEEEVYWETPPYTTYEHTVEEDKHKVSGNDAVEQGRQKNEEEQQGNGEKDWGLEEWGKRENGEPGWLKEEREFYHKKDEKKKQKEKTLRKNGHEEEKQKGQEEDKADEKPDKSGKKTQHRISGYEEKGQERDKEWHKIREEYRQGHANRGRKKFGGNSEDEGENEPLHSNQTHAIIHDNVPLKDLAEVVEKLRDKARKQERKKAAEEEMKEDEKKERPKKKGRKRKNGWKEEEREDVPEREASMRGEEGKEGGRRRKSEEKGNDIAEESPGRKNVGEKEEVIDKGKGEKRKKVRSGHKDRNRTESHKGERSEEGRKERDEDEYYGWIVADVPAHLESLTKARQEWEVGGSGERESGEAEQTTGKRGDVEDWPAELRSLDSPEIPVHPQIPEPPLSPKHEEGKIEKDGPSGKVTEKEYRNKFTKLKVQTKKTKTYYPEDALESHEAPLSTYYHSFISFTLP